MSLSTTNRRAGIAAMATSLALGACALSCGAASAAHNNFKFYPVSGNDRYATSAKAADAFGKANTVILANGEPGHYPDALAANYLAGLKNAPVLLTHTNAVPSEVQKAIADSGAQNVIIVGGTGVVSQSVQSDLAKTYKVRRIAGDDRFGTDAAVINEGDQASTDTALLATGFDFPDALGGGPLAFAQKMPLAITRAAHTPSNVVKALKQAGIDHVLILGGKDVVSDAVETQLKNNGITVTDRFAGSDRAETSTLLAAYEV
ncbi:MAG: cell wall-binding repeat-containing protein, partial [Nocardioidaceae bacterium]